MIVLNLFCYSRHEKQSWKLNDFQQKYLPSRGNGGGEKSRKNITNLMLKFMVFNNLAYNNRTWKNFSTFLLFVIFTCSLNIHDLKVKVNFDYYAR